MKLKLGEDNTDNKVNIDTLNSWLTSCLRHKALFKQKLDCEIQLKTER